MTTKEYIIDGSAKMFIDAGVKGVRMDDIAAKLAISKRTIYEHFRDKREIVAAALEHLKQKHSEEQEICTREAGNIVEEIVLLLKWWEKSAGSINRFVFDVYKFYPDIYERFADKQTREGMDVMRRKLAAGIEEGYLLPSLNVDMTMYVFSNSVAALVFGEKSQLPPGVSRQDLFRFIIVYFFRGIATKKGIKIMDEYINNR